MTNEEKSWCNQRCNRIRSTNWRSLISSRGSPMGTVLKIQVVRYLDEQGHRVPKGTPGARKVREKSAKWYGQYADAHGDRRRVPLCTDKAAARQMLAELE